MLWRKAELNEGGRGCVVYLGGDPGAEGGSKQSACLEEEGSRRREQGGVPSNCRSGVEARG